MVGKRNDDDQNILKMSRLDSTLPVPHVDEGEDAVECDHQDVRHGQVQQEVVSDAPHPPVGYKE